MLQDTLTTRYQFHVLLNMKCQIVAHMFINKHYLLIDKHCLSINLCSSVDDGVNLDKYCLLVDIS